MFCLPTRIGADSRRKFAYLICGGRSQNRHSLNRRARVCDCYSAVTVRNSTFCFSTRAIFQLKARRNCARFPWLLRSRAFRWPRNRYRGTRHNTLFHRKWWNFKVAICRKNGGKRSEVTRATFDTLEIVRAKIRFCSELRNRRAFMNMISYRIWKVSRNMQFLWSLYF